MYLFRIYKERSKIKKGFIFLILFLLTISNSVLSQTKVDNIKLGDQYFAEGDYYTASQYYKKTMRKNNPDMNAVFKYAEACRLCFYYQEAEKWYDYILKKDTKNKYSLCAFWIGMVKKSLGKYSEAKEYFQRYNDKNKKKNDYYSQTAMHETQACDIAVQIIKDTLPVEIIHLDSAVNTVNTEFDAFQLNDSVLIYSSLRKISTEQMIPDESPASSYSSGDFTTRIYQSVKQNNQWRKGKELSPVINLPNKHNANFSFQEGTKKFYFTRCSNLLTSGMICSILMTEKVNGKWLTPVELNKKINLPGFTATQPFAVDLDSSKSILFFVSDRPGGIGNLDIWFSVVSKKKYSDPVNLGKPVNTIGNEMSPFYDFKTNYLYFSSDWHSGLGGYDIFKSKGMTDKWTEPLNMGFPFNTSANDLYMTIKTDDSSGYITSNRPGTFFEKYISCCNDIFSFKWKRSDTIKSDTVKFVTYVPFDSSFIQKPLLPITLYFPNDEPDPKSFKSTTRKNYLSILKRYVLLKDEYKSEYAQGLESQEKALAEVKSNIFFEKYVFSVENKLEEFTSGLLFQLEQDDTVKLLIQGFCSPLHASEYNLNLSKRRINSFKNYLLDYNHNVFQEYIENHQLTISEEPYGKEKAGRNVSDNLNDKKNSVYSPEAAMERKIEIQILK